MKGNQPESFKINFTNAWASILPFHQKRPFFAAQIRSFISMRRVIRIKAMQGLYTYFNNKTVNYEDIRQKVFDGLIENPEFYNADQNDKTGFQKLLPVLLDEAFASQLNIGELPPNQKWLGKLAAQAVSDWNNENKKEIARIKSALLLDIQNQLPTEISFWQLFSALIQSVKGEENRRLDSYLDNIPAPGHELKIIHHPYNELLSLALHPDEGRPPIGLKPFDSEFVQRAYSSFFKEIPEYIEYKNKKSVTPEEQDEIYRVLYRKLFRSDIYNEAMAEMDMHWSENRIFLEVSLKETYKKLSAGEVPVFSVDKDDATESIHFFETLFNSCLEHVEEDQKLISQVVTNWDSDRLAVLDMWIILLTINEMRKFPHIPIKVTMNEYLEIAKAYSTPGSSGFINGVVDKIASMMKTGGSMKKSARGLMDNK